MRGVLVVDDHPIVLEVMSAIVRSIFTQAHVYLAVSLASAIELAQITQGIELVLLDLGLPDAIGIEVLTRFLAACPLIPVVVVSSTEDRDVVLAALQAGARGYVPKTSKQDVIVAALRLVAAGGVYVPAQAIAQESPPSEPLLARDLTGRQMDVLRLLAKGLANKQIAKQLRIAHDTVRNHARALYAALGVQSRSEAARAAKQRGINLD